MIHAEDVTALLRLENPNEHQSSTTFNYLNLKRPLEQIEKEIVQMAVRENNGNQSAAAKQLGISRTTLWRIYKNSE
jgi:transcriptional regulator with PAS, ATPase and Fis domain